MTRQSSTRRSVRATWARWIGCSTTYGEVLERLQAWLTVRHPRNPGDSDFVHRQAIRAKALDATRGMLPAASLSNVGIYGTGQSYEQLLIRMRAHPLPEARHYAAMMLTELRKVIPSFLQRVDRPDRGGAHSAYLVRTRTQSRDLVEQLFPDLVAPEGQPAPGPGGMPSVTLLEFDPDGEEKVLAAICAPLVDRTESEVTERTCAGSGPRIAGRSWPRTWGIGPIAGTDRDGPSSVRAIGSRSSPTTARSATSSAIACSPSSGSRLGRRSVTTFPMLVEDAGLRDQYVGSLERSRGLAEELVEAFPIESCLCRRARRTAFAIRCS